MTNSFIKELIEKHFPETTENEILLWINEALKAIDEGTGGMNDETVIEFNSDPGKIYYDSDDNSSIPNFVKIWRVDVDGYPISRLAKAKGQKGYGGSNIEFKDTTLRYWWVKGQSVGIAGFSSALCPSASVHSIKIYGQEALPELSFTELGEYVGLDKQFHMAIVDKALALAYFGPSQEQFQASQMYETRFLEWIRKMIAYKNDNKVDATTIVTPQLPYGFY